MRPACDIGQVFGTPPQIVHDLHGSPRMDICVDTESGRCLVCCGEMTRGQPVDKWLKSSFTDQNRTRNPLATHVCESCCYVMSRTSPVIGRPPKADKKFGGNFRNYAHMFEAGWESPGYGETGTVGSGYVNASKGDKPLIREFLRRDHSGMWFAGIADSGQKHVLPFTRMNAPGSCGVVMFEEQPVVVPGSLDLVDEMAALLTAGATKEEVSRGDYKPQTWIRCRDELRAFEKKFGNQRHSPWWSLAVWLSQRDEDAVSIRLAAEKEDARAKLAKRPRASNGNRKVKRANKRANREAVNDDSRSAASPTCGVLPDGECKPAEELGHPTEPSSSGGSNVSKPARVGNKAAKRPADTEHPQRRLPGFG